MSIATAPSASPRRARARARCGPAWDCRNAARATRGAARFRTPPDGGATVPTERHRAEQPRPPSTHPQGGRGCSFRIPHLPPPTHTPTGTSWRNRLKLNLSVGRPRGYRRSARPPWPTGLRPRADPRQDTLRSLHRCSHRQGRQNLQARILDMAADPGHLVTRIDGHLGPRPAPRPRRRVRRRRTRGCAAPTVPGSARRWRRRSRDRIRRPIRGVAPGCSASIHTKSGTSISWPTSPLRTPMVSFTVTSGPSWSAPPRGTRRASWHGGHEGAD